MDGFDDEQVPEQPEFNAKSDMRNVVLKKEMKFPNAKVFRAALREYAVKKLIDIKFKLNERTKISVHYKNEYRWRCYASQISGELTFQIKTLTDDLYRSKRKAKDWINGDEQLQYGVLMDYAQMINTVDKGSRVILQTEMTDETSQPKFKRMYVRFNAQKGGQRSFSWSSFLIGKRYCVKHIYNNFKIDHKGLELKDALWRCAAATTVREFERCMQYIKDLDEKAYEYLANIAPAQWTRSHFTPRALTDCLINNLSESFNLMILKSKDKPILAMLEWIRVRLMTRLYTKREGIEKYAKKLCPSIQDKFEKLKVESKPFSSTPAGSFLYEVASQYKRHVVDLVKKTCNCRYWDLNGIPCKHAITAIYTNIETSEAYTHPCYHKETYMEIYKEVLPPMPGQSKWVETGQPAP
ncbi:uncharacterized protein LOC112002940 [Quercus suber]|uniref:uncharacterized protein LOC112002940 n=1 Tax=Quercus suber TaxID=58331 RepID=UPI000CE1A36C|nr:uncharacterized protein LOC112002940 [Quercus suber]